MGFLLFTSILLLIQLKYLNGLIFEIGVFAAVALVVGIVSATYVQMKTGLVSGLAVAFFGEVMILHRVLAVNYDIDGFLTNVPHLKNHQLPYYRRMQISFAITTFGLALAFASLFLNLYDGRVFPRDREHPFIWSIALAVASLAPLIAEVKEPAYLPIAVLMLTTLVMLGHSAGLRNLPMAPKEVEQVPVKRRIGLKRRV